MKKLLVVLLAMIAVINLSKCGNEKIETVETEEILVEDSSEESNDYYADFMASMIIANALQDITGEDIMSMDNGDIVVTDDGFYVKGRFVSVEYLDEYIFNSEENWF